MVQELVKQRRAENAADDLRISKPLETSVVKKLTQDQKIINTLDSRRETNVESLVTIGNKEAKSDPQSGSIMKVLLRIDGMRSRIANGVNNGHTYNIIHMPGSSHFLFEDHFTGADGKQETSRQSFVIEAYHAQESREFDEWDNVISDVDYGTNYIINLAI